MTTQAHRVRIPRRPLPEPANVRFGRIGLVSRRRTVASLAGDSGYPMGTVQVGLAQTGVARLTGSARAGHGGLPGSGR